MLVAVAVGMLMVSGCADDDGADSVAEPVAVDPDGIDRLERLMNAGELPTSAGLSRTRLGDLLGDVRCELDRDLEAELAVLDDTFVHAEVAKIVALCPSIDPRALGDLAPGIDEADIARMQGIAGSD